MNNMESYKFSQYLHNFSVWTAASAVNRNFTTTKNISDVINKICLIKFVLKYPKMTPEKFNRLHKKLCNYIINEFEKMKIKCSYGRAAKIIAIYLKTSIIITEKGEGSFTNVIHPPIDRIFLNNISNKFKEKDFDFKKVAWTKLTENEYWKIYDKILERIKFFNWQLEEYWNPVS